MAWVNTKIGDIFSIKIGDSTKRYFQLVAFDLTQLNSDVIRAFKKVYPIDFEPDLLEIVKDDIEFYTHCVTKLGLKMGFWNKVGTITEVGNTEDILFRDTEDYGSKIGGENIKISSNWYVWRINEEFEDVGRLEGENRNSYVGLIINPLGIIELLEGNKYPINYPNFE